MSFLRFFIFGFLLLLPVTFFAQMDFRKLSDEEAVGVLAGFRAYRMEGDFCMKFNITHYLRKSDESSLFTGKIFGTWDKTKPILRIEIARATEPDKKKSFLLRGGDAPELWTLDAENRPVRVDSDTTVPFFEDLIFTPFELQTPFVFWRDAKYEQTKRFRGRPVHFFKMTPPEKFQTENPTISFVRIGFDRVYNALVSVEIFNESGRLKKTFSLSRVQKVQEQYTIRELELRDDTTRDKDNLIVYAAALGLKLPLSAFAPEALVEAPPFISESRFSHL